MFFSRFIYLIFAHSFYSQLSPFVSGGRASVRWQCMSTLVASNKMENNNLCLTNTKIVKKHKKKKMQNFKWICAAFILLWKIIRIKYSSFYSFSIRRGSVWVKWILVAQNMLNRIAGMPERKENRKVQNKTKINMCADLNLTHFDFRLGSAGAHLQ